MAASVVFRQICRLGSLSTICAVCVNECLVTPVFPSSKADAHSSHIFLAGDTRAKLVRSGL